MFCEMCGKKLPDGARFCTGCGARIGGSVPKEDMERRMHAGAEASSKKYADKEELNRDLGFDLSGFSDIPEGAGNHSSASEMFQKFVKASKEVFKELVPMMKNPVRRVWTLAKEEDKTKIYGLVIFHLIALFLYAIISLAIVNKRFDENFFHIEIPYVRTALILVIITAIYYFGMAAAFLLTTKVFFKEQTSYAKMLSVMSGNAAINALCFAVALIGYLLSVKLGTILLDLGLLYAAFAMVMSFTAVSRLRENKKLYAFFISVIIYIVFAALCLYFLEKSLEANSDIFSLIIDSLLDR